MARIDSASEIKQQPTPGKAAIIASLLFPFIGIACILAPEGIMNFLPYLLGGLMLVVGAADLITDLTDPNKKASSISQGSDVVMIVVGGMLLVKGTALLTLVGVVWGFIGLSKAAGEIDETFHAIRARAPFALLALSSAIEVVLGTLLIASPLENIEHHVLLLDLAPVHHPQRQRENAPFRRSVAPASHPKSKRVRVLIPLGTRALYHACRQRAVVIAGCGQLSTYRSSSIAWAAESLAIGTR